MVDASVRDLQRMHDVLKKNGAKYDDNGKIIKGSWRRGAIKKAAEELGVSRPTIYTYIKGFPRPPQRELRKKPVIPKYVEEWKESQTVKDFEENCDRLIAQKKLSDSSKSRYMYAGLQAWRILGKKDPISWTEEDYRTCWEHPDLRDTETGLISFHHAIGLRQWMVHCKMLDLPKMDYFSTKGLKRKKGRKLAHWISTEQDFINVINNIERPDTLMMFNIGIQCGARFSSLRLIKVADIMYATNSILMYEPKVKETEERVFLEETLQNLKLYVYHMGYEGKHRIFTARLHEINDDLKQAGKKARIPFDLTTHVGMKHTFVSFASNHGVSLEVVSLQTGTDPNTLMQYYAGVGKGKIRHELLGEKLEEPDYHETMKRLQPIIAQRYEEIKDAIAATKTVTVEIDGKKVKKKINWNSIEKMASNPNTPEALRKYWTEALKLHKEGLSYSEIKKRLQK